MQKIFSIFIGGKKKSMDINFQTDQLIINENPILWFVGFIIINRENISS